MFKKTIFIFALASLGICIAEPIKDVLAAKSSFDEDEDTSIVEVEYLESSGSQWIDTGIQGSTTYSIIAIYVQPLAGNDNNYVFGGGDSTSSGFGFRIRGLTSTTFTAGFGWTGAFQYWNRALAEAPQSIMISGGPRRFSVNGYFANTLSFSGTYDATFVLFGRKIGDVVYPCLPIRFYGAQIGDFYFVPVRIGRVGAMLETTTGELFFNEGSGNFILGPDKE